MAERNPQAKKASPESFVDLSVLQELEQSRIFYSALEKLAMDDDPSKFSRLEKIERAMFSNPRADRPESRRIKLRQS